MLPFLLFKFKPKLALEAPIVFQTMAAAESVLLLSLSDQQIVIGEFPHVVSQQGQTHFSLQKSQILNRQELWSKPLVKGK